MDGAPARNAPSPEVYLDFRGGKLPPPSLTSWSDKDGEEFIHAEEKGLRISLPAGRQRTVPVGLLLDVPVQGDFEITSRYELLRTDNPQSGRGVGYELFIMTRTSSLDAVVFSRIKATDGRNLYLCGRNTTVKGARKSDIAEFDANDTSGRLRLTRRGTEIIFWAAEGDAAEFRELCRRRLGLEDLNMIRMSAYPGQAPEAVDVRLVDVKVRSDAPIDDVLIADPSKPKKWLIALVVCLALLLSAAAVGWWLMVRRNRRSAKERRLGCCRPARTIAVRCSCPFFPLFLLWEAPQSQGGVGRQEGQVPPVRHRGSGAASRIDALQENEVASLDHLACFFRWSAAVPLSRLALLAQQGKKLAG